MRVRSGLAWLIVLVTLPWRAADAAAWEPPGGGIFNNPVGSLSAQWRVIHHVERAIRRTPSGATILISGFLFDSATAADALLRAHARGVRVQIVFDTDLFLSYESRRVADVLNQDNIDPATGQPYLDANGNPLRWGPDGSFVVFCQGGCRGDGARTNNHSKFYAFSRTGTARHVTMVSSSNLNHGGAVLGWNDLYTIKYRRKVFRDFATIHREMAEDTPRDDRYRELVTGRYTYRFFPTTDDRDPTMRDLSRVRCRGATGGSGRDGRTTIHISMFGWRLERGRRLAEKIVRLDGRGCDVNVIYGAPGREVATILKESARNGGIRLWDSRYDRSLDGIFDLRVHEKYLLVSGVYDGDTSSWLVHTGSQNWGGSLRYGDDVTLNIRSRAAHRQYLANWNFIRKYGARRVR